MVHSLEVVALGRPHEVRAFAHGRFEIYRIGAQAIGRAVYEPGWRWTEHVKPGAGTDLCEVAHIGLVIAGTAALRMADGAERLLTEGEFFAIPPGHDSWVVGDQPYVSLHFLGADDYAAPAIVSAAIRR